MDAQGRPAEPHVAHAGLGLDHGRELEHHSPTVLFLVSCLLGMCRNRGLSRSCGGGRAGGKRNRSFKTMETARNTRQIANENRQGRRLARTWDQAVPKDKWAEVVVSIFEFRNICSMRLVNCFFGV